MQQRELLDFLVRGEQVAFDAVGEELQRALAFLAALHALALLRQPLGDPLRQRGALDGSTCRLTPLPSSAENQAPLRVALSSRGSMHQRERAVVARRGLGDLLQRGAAVLARLARGDADLDDLLVGEQAERAAGREHGAPVEMRAGHGVRSCARCSPARARRRGWHRPPPAPAAARRHGSCRAAPRPWRGAPRAGRAPVACGMPRSAAVMSSVLTAARRRNVCCAMSFCMSRKSSSVSPSLASAAVSL